MKNLLVILLIVLGTVTANAQGWLGYSQIEVMQNLEEQSFSGNVETGTSNDGTNYLSVSKPTYEWVIFFNDSSITYESHLISHSWQEFTGNVNVFDKNFVKTGDGHWINAWPDGAVNIKTKMYTYSDFPVFIFTYKTY